MPNPFDAANKHLVRPHPADWLALAGLPVGRSIKIVDVDLSAVSAAADKLLQVDGPSPYMAHQEFQSGPDNDLDLRILGYNVLARRQFRLAVRSVVFALRPQAITPRVRGHVLDGSDPDFELQFRYRLIRVWELPPAKLLDGGIGTLPLAPISAVTQAQLPAMIETMAKRFDAEAPASEVPDLWSVTRILLGLKWPRSVVGPLLKGALKMRESDTYQEILEEGVEIGVARGVAQGVAQGVEQGREQEARSIIIRTGSKRYGPPSESIRSRLESISDVTALEAIMDRLVEGAASSWADLILPSVA
jgi:predicted transposase YdaD